MTLPVAGLVATARATRKVRYEWLFSPRADLGMLLLPVMATSFALALARHLGQDVGGTTRVYLGWVAAFLFGNTSHVILTFLVVGARRDMLHATDRQARTVVVGSLLAFAVTLTLSRLTRNDPTTRLLLEAAIVVLATHHTLSQAKGFWALYTLRGSKDGLPAPSARERELQKLFVPVGLLFIAIKWTLVGEAAYLRASPYVNVNPGYPAVLPFGLTYALIGAWLIYVALLFRALTAYQTLNGAKLVYLGTQCSVVTLELVSPGWGITVAAGIHGLEYYLLTRKMLAPTASEAGSKLTAARCWPAMLAAMSPILFVGFLRNPFVSVNLLGEDMGGWAFMLVNATVLAHYCADAFLYRFRIPGVRKVALGRLGLG